MAATPTLSAARWARQAIGPVASTLETALRVDLFPVPDSLPEDHGLVLEPFELVRRVAERLQVWGVVPVELKEAQPLRKRHLREILTDDDEVNVALLQPIASHGRSEGDSFAYPHSPAQPLEVTVDHLPGSLTLDRMRSNTLPVLSKHSRAKASLYTSLGRANAASTYRVVA